MGSCILIENSNVFIRIKNCTVFNSGLSDTYVHAGIRFNNVNNATLIGNNCSSNYYGIYLSNSDNNTISSCTARIYLTYSDRILVSNNINSTINLYWSNNVTISGNQNCGIRLEYSISNKITNNTSPGLRMKGSLIHLNSHEIDTSNLINQKPLYYYKNELNLGPANYTNAGQVILVNCNDSLVANLNISFTSGELSLFYCNGNNITQNIAKNNNYYGIYLWACNNNSISDNVLMGNHFSGLYLDHCDYNNITEHSPKNNDVGIYLRYSNYNIIFGNSPNENHRGVILSDSDYNYITGNNASVNNQGIIIFKSHNNTISANTANGQSTGIYLSESHDNDIMGNTINSNSWGCYLYFSNFNTISGNTMNFNENGGADLYHSDNNVISGNTANSNGRYGIFLDSSDYNVVNGNTLIDNVECIAERDCTGNKFSDNGFCIPGGIPGFDIFIIVSVLCAVAFILGKRLKKNLDKNSGTQPLLNTKPLSSLLNISISRFPHLFFSRGHHGGGRE